MTDLASLVLGIPSYVEGFVKLARTVKKYQALAKDHILAVEDVMFCAETLDYYAGFIDANDPETMDHPSCPLLEEALVHAYDALDSAQLILHDWSVRLEPKVNQHGRKLLARMASSVSEKLAGGKSKSSERTLVLKRFNKSLSEAAYLAFGVVEIKETMTRLNTWINRFSQLLLTSPNLRLRNEKLIGGRKRKMTDSVDFVARARDRLKREQLVRVFGFDKLESMFDIDVVHRSGIRRLAGGDFAGCIVDLRDLRLSQDIEAVQEEYDDTFRICRLFAETPADREIGSRSNVGILPCIGYAVGEATSKHFLIYRLPPGTGSPCTLRSLLVSGPARHSLNDRLHFCIKLARSVLIVHSLGLVHKNIRPDSVLVVNLLHSENVPSELGTPYLVGFGQARLAAGPTAYRPYNGQDLVESMYIHPRHTSSGDRMKWQMRDDIYSLGVTLFEIAIWRSFVKWDSNAGGYVLDPNSLEVSDERYEGILQRRGRSIDHDKTWMRRSDMIKYASEMIPATMGDTFKDIVVRCLYFGDDRIFTEDEVLEMSLEEDSKEEKANQQSVAFVEEILTKMRRLVFAY